MTVNHSEVRKAMPDYLEGDLPLGRRALLDAHLDECADCAREIAAMRRTIAALRSLPDPEVPANLVDDVMRRIRAGESRGGAWARVREWIEAALEPRVLAPVSAAALVAGLLLGTGQLRELIETQAGQRPGPPGAVLDGSAAGSDGIAGQPSRPGGLAGLPPANAGELAAGLGPGLVSGSEGASRTPGQELIALVQMLEERSSRRSRFSDWPPVVPAPSTHSPTPTRQVVARSGDGALDVRRLAPDQSALPRVGGPPQRWPSADEWLERLQQRPAEFADRMAGSSLAEQEHWVDSLARRAVEQDRLDAVVAALRTSPSRRAQVLADDFAAAGARLRADATPVRRAD